RVAASAVDTAGAGVKTAGKSTTGVLGRGLEASKHAAGATAGAVETGAGATKHGVAATVGTAGSATAGAVKTGAAATKDGTLEEAQTLLLQRLENLPGVPVHLNFREHSLHLSIFADDVGGPRDAHDLAAVQVLFLPDPVGFKRVVRGVAEQREIQLVLVAELLELLHRVAAHPDHSRPELFQFFFGVTELVRLAGSTRRVGLGKEVEHQ